jgi:hypothetical protein
MQSAGTVNRCLPTMAVEKNMAGMARSVSVSIKIRGDMGASRKLCTVVFMAHP